jgi:hypothetical protein
MALVNPNIAMSFRAPEIQQPNMLADYAAIQQIQGGRQAQELNALKIQEYERTRAEEEGARNFLRGRDLALPDTRAGLTQFGKTGLALAKSLSEQDAATLSMQNVKSQISERDFGLQDKKLKFAWGAIGDASTPELAIQKITDAIKDGVFKPQDGAAEIQQLQGMTPELFRQYRVNKVLQLLDAKDKLVTMLPKITRQEAGGQIVSIQDNPALPGYGLPVAGMAPIAKTATIGETTAQGQLAVSQGQLGVSRGQLGVAQQRLNFEREKAAQPVFNAQAGGFVAPPTKENPQGIFIPATKIQAAKDQSAAVRALQSAGYNVETGEDNISKLIEKSTSGGLQAGSAAALAFFGKSTEGRKAIAALEGTANQIATDLAGGKLGAGISNTDREFIVGALGDVANPMKTAEERLSGWTAAKNRMMLTGLIPPPKTAGAAAGVDTSNPLLQVSP